MTKRYSIILIFALALISKINAQTLNYYFGNIHAHSSYSDGNKDSSTSNLTTPLQDFNYANASQHIDFYGISEHNHFSAGMLSPVYYHKGLADADSATVDGSFVALYGMEWGVISSGGHVIIYGYDSLMGWDANDYDVYVGQHDYTKLWRKINEKQGAFAYLAHPESGDFNNLLSNTVNLSADNAIVGMPARSGPAFSTNTSYSNPATSSNITDYNNALRQGFHLGIGLDHDTHNSVFGRQSAGRLVVMAPALTRPDILNAFRKMRFYSSDDWNTEVDFNIGNLPMGSIITQAGSPTINVTVNDPNVSEETAYIAIYSGIPGSGSNPTILSSISNSETLTYTHTIADNSSYYYYLKITQDDGDIIWTSPIWYTRNDAVTNNPPVANFSPSSVSICTGQQITFIDNSTNGPTDWNWSLSGALPDTSTNQNFTAVYSTPGIYTVLLTASNASGTDTITKIITVQTCTGIEEAIKKTIKLYPNPANQLLTIDMSALPDEKIIEIYDLAGRKVLSKISREAMLNLELSSFESGVYNVKILINNSVYTSEKFTVERK